ncbi:hypothetical protein PHYSODRAFT_498473 [Phytophthora sojae]|uniref:Uncharacterized protein n=1 Tax=Phytophthora sojae (strain P6497) TaxID=1094619 RepID=G4ZJL1_PHYSP|nr:hypothetical protein PHYSODRAFT_498473 [Phytophthora sojae]EGZ18231.1 hypothetical protein PHYSODRAFT_498473 [Phytophthora sojae]|eukprot:XP_009527289.1 hypothetical protein PHYSODRAFT_498473 [Phytophthora sojae]
MQQRPATHTRTEVVRANDWVLKLSKAWLAVQLTTYGGKYSIERILALDKYIQQTPLYRAVLVCIAVPTTLILLVFGQESIPLQDPYEGWSSNYGFWVRVCLLGAAVGYAAATYVGYMIDGAALPRRQLALFTVGVAMSYTAVNIAVAAWLVFPIPFQAFSTNVFIMFILIGLYRVVVGGSVFREVFARRGELLAFKNFVLVQISMLLAYPAFQILFGLVTNTRWEVPVLMILPIMKLVMKNLMVRTIRHREDMIPEEVIFIVDFFDALYLATCMQNASSTTSVIGVVCHHLIQSAVELRELRRKTRSTFVRLHKEISRSSASDNSAERKTVECARLLHDVAEVLFTSECLVLTEFLETVIPILYGNYVLLMVHLPSAQYHTEMAYVTKENVAGMVQGIFVYGFLEWLSCTIVAVIMYRDCGIRALHQLAFVIETQIHLVQAKLVLYVMITLTYRVVHFGTSQHELGGSGLFAIFSL